MTTVGMTAIERRSVDIPEGLIAVLDGMHDAYGKHNIQTVRGGTQVSLAYCPYRVVRRFVQGLELGPLAGIWSVRMAQGGYHIAHNHPQGSRSGVLYLRTGEGGELVVDGEHITPQPGLLLLFDSSTPHGTTPFAGDGTRLTIAFDIAKPAERAAA